MKKEEKIESLIEKIMKDIKRWNNYGGGQVEVGILISTLSHIVIDLKNIKK